MTFELGMIFAGVSTFLVLGALVIPGQENRELVRTLGFVVGFWTLVIAILN